jgi:hypothetical protein
MSDTSISNFTDWDKPRLFRMTRRAELREAKARHLAGGGDVVQPPRQATWHDHREH